MVALCDFRSCVLIIPASLHHCSLMAQTSTKLDQSRETPLRRIYIYMLLQFTAAPSRLTKFSLRSMNMLSIIIWAKLIVLALVGHVSGQWASIPFNPPTVPLADRTPYLNAWITQGPNSLSDGYPSSRVFSVSGISLLSFPHSATRPLPPPGRSHTQTI